MPEKGAQFRFRVDVEERSAQSKLGLPLRIWCMLGGAGLCIGLATWFGGRSLLENRFSQQLATSSSDSETLAAITGLAKLDTDAQFEIAAALGGQDDNAARMAYRVLDDKLSAWVSLNSEERIRRMAAIAERLGRLPDSINSERKVLAGSLASRILGFIVLDAELTDTSLRSVCQTVLQRANQAALVDLRMPEDQPATSAEAVVSQGVGKAMVLSSPPPPLPPVESASVQPGVTSQNNTVHLSDQSSVPLVSSSAQIFHNAATPTSVPSNREQASMLLVSDRSASISGVTNQPQPTIPDVHDPLQVSSITSAQQGVQTTPEYAASVALTPSSRSITSFTVEKTLAAVPTGALPESNNREPVRPALKQDSRQFAVASDAELLRMLSDFSPQVAQAAALEFRRRGMSDERLQMAAELASGTAQIRLRIIDDLIRLRDINPQPWLLWMADVGQPPVRLKAVSLLATVNDADVRRELQLMLNREPEGEIATVIRQALLSGATVR